MLENPLASTIHEEPLRERKSLELNPKLIDKASSLEKQEEERGLLSRLQDL